jgi:hypothetical protein
MTPDYSDSLEADLLRLRPAAPPPELEARIAAAIDRLPSRNADRVLSAFLATAAAAACLSITLISLDLRSTTASPPPTAAAASLELPRALARLDANLP